MRPSWDEYFLLFAHTASLRSEDPDIQHGAVIINQYNHVIATGYNGTIKNADILKIPFYIRDEKRKWMIHAEENAMLNVTQNISERGEHCRLYVTGMPCNNCLQRIVNFGIKKIIMIDRPGSITDSEETEKMRKEILEMSNVELIKFPITNRWMVDFFKI